ncbi:MAG: hypothetical protein AAFP09_00995 [Cyanobacteria bacterium J06607_10]
MNSILECVCIPEEVKGAAHAECLQRVSNEWTARFIWMAYYSIPAIDITRSPFLSSGLRLQKEFGKLLWEISKLIRVLWETVPAYRHDYPWKNPLIAWQKVALELRNRDQELKVGSVSKSPITDERKRWEQFAQNIQSGDVQVAVQALSEGFKMRNLEGMLTVATETRQKLKGRQLKDFDIDGWVPFTNQLEKMYSSSFQMPAPYQATRDGLQILKGKPHMTAPKTVFVSSLPEFRKQDPNRLAVVPLRLEINEADGSINLHAMEVNRVKELGETLVFVK